MNSIYIKYTSHEQVIKGGAALVNTISSFVVIALLVAELFNILIYAN